MNFEQFVHQAHQMRGLRRWIMSKSGMSAGIGVMLLLEQIRRVVDRSEGFRNS